MNIDEGLDGLKQDEAKLASYHNTPFTKVCLGMTRDDVTSWILVNYTATSLYNLIADGNYHATNAGRAEWVSLIKGSSLQQKCNKEGFNVECRFRISRMSRIGLFSNDQDHCGSCNTIIGFGIEIKDWKLSSGNIHYRSQVQQKYMKLSAFGYIFVQ